MEGTRNIVPYLNVSQLLSCYVCSLNCIGDGIHECVLHTYIATAVAGSSCSSSLLLQDMEPLADLFSGVVVHFHGVPEGDVRRFTRYVVAYNGEVDETLSERTTHILYHPGNKVRKQCHSASHHTYRLLFPTQAPPSTLPPGCQAVTISTTWLEDCLSQNKLLPTTPYASHTHL